MQMLLMPQNCIFIIAICRVSGYVQNMKTYKANCLILKRIFTDIRKPIFSLVLHKKPQFYRILSVYPMIEKNQKCIRRKSIKMFACFNVKSLQFDQAYIIWSKFLRWEFQELSWSSYTDFRWNSAYSFSLKAGKTPFWYSLNGIFCVSLIS